LSREALQDFLVVKPPFAHASLLPSHSDKTSARSFLAFTTLALRVEGRKASFLQSKEQQTRSELEAALAPLKLTWLTLEHGAQVVLIPATPATDAENVLARCSNDEPPATIIADAAVVNTPGFAAAFTTADCLPVVLASESHGIIAGIHAGWRSIAGDIIKSCGVLLASQCCGNIPGDLMAWIGPSIAPEHYEIDDITRSKLLSSSSVHQGHFSPTSPGHYLADLPAMVTAQLNSLGVPDQDIFKQPGSTFTDRLYHSARRDGRASGRMATVIGILPG
jgi:YfiH family protein